MRNKNNVIRDTVIEESFALPGRDLGNWTQLYIDDLTVGETHALEQAKSHISVHKEKKTIHAYHCEETFAKVSEESKKIGMVINPLKTQLICISDHRHTNIESYIMAGDQRIDSMAEMKVLGFIFENKPSVGAHIDHCLGKFKKAIWALTHLKRAKICENVLIKVYTTMLRPLLEYSAPVYHSMLTQTMSESLEKQQRRALRIIYGFDLSNQELLEKAKIRTMKERRIEAFEKFTVKLSNSSRFSSLFPENNVRAGNMELRHTKNYIEEFARTDRLYHSPVYAMRRYLNE